MSGSLQEILVEELRDLLDAEKQLVKALPKMAKSASDEELENAFREHLEVTRGQVQRLEQVFEMLDERARGKPCKGMKGLVEEGREIIEEQEGDSAMACAARKVEHYEMAGYQEAHAIARQLGLRDAAQLLEETLREEMETDKRLAQISRRLAREMFQGGGKEEPRRGRASTGGRGAGARGAQITTDHQKIRQWAEERGARPACVKGTGNRQDTGMIRLDFPGYTGGESLQPVSWDDWFEKFEDNNLALLFQETTARGERSSFNKLVSRESGAGRGRRRQASGRARAAR